SNLEGRGMSHSKATKAPLDSTSEDWAQLPWRKLEQHVYRLQQRIFRAGDTWQQASSPSITPVTDAIPISPPVGGATGDPGQPGQEDRRGRRESLASLPQSD